jgi:spermidine synthase
MIPPSESPPRQSVLAILFVLSGFSALCYQVILSRYTQLIVGSTAYAISALLVAFMAGMAVGSAVGGRLADRWDRPLRLYGFAEALIGLYCIAFPAMFPLIEAVYLRLVPAIGVETSMTRHAVRFIVGVAAFFVPSVLMGVTTPAFARAVAATRPDSGSWLARLYGWNTFGAACGAFATAYVLVPVFGMRGSMILASLFNFGVAVTAVRLASVVPPDSSARRARDGGSASPAWPGMSLLVATAFTSGLFSFGLEIIWTHLLAVLLGNSVYAFGLMLGSLLLGLALGTLLARRLVRDGALARTAIGLCLAASGLTVVATLGVWDQIPSIFLLMARSTPTFWTMELARLIVAFGLMLAPTLFLGACFPLVLHCTTVEGTGFARPLGVTYAANTIGAVLGAVVGSYVLLPRLGSLLSLRLLGVGLLLAGAVLLLRLCAWHWRRLAALATLGIAGVGAVFPVEWDFNSLNLAAAVYLGSSLSQKGEMLFRQEDPSGGLTTVVGLRGVNTLLTNGKFQGDNSEEVPIQHRLANIPTLFTPDRERALVIGLGTGVTLASLAAHGFRETVCAEISGPIVTAARQHFRDVNRGVLDWPSVRLIEEDGRSVLMEMPQRYDVISVEITTIWFAGVGSIYSREFYQLAASRLRRNGVMLQWFPIHHLSPRNLYVVVNTVRSVFPYVSVWTHRHQGFVIASNEPLMIDLESVRLDEAHPALQPFLRDLPSRSPLELLSDVVVTDDDVDAFLDGMANLLRAPRTLVSTDTWPMIEYETPKDILDNFAYFQNRATFQRFRSTRAFPFRGQPTETESRLASAAFSRGWADPRALPRLAHAWRSPGADTGTISRWFLDELSHQDFAGGGYPSDPLVDFGAGAPGLAEFVAAVGQRPACTEPDEFLLSPDAVPLIVARFGGETLLPSRPQSAVDGVIAADQSQPWRVRPDGVAPWIELLLDRPRRLASVGVLARSIDGSVVRTRLLGRDAQGRWYPLSAGARAEDVLCTGARTLELPASAPELTALRVEMQGEALSHRLALHEVWAIGRR